MPKIGFNTAISACGAEWTVALQLMREMHRQAGFPWVNVIPILISTLQSSNDEHCLLFKVQVCVKRFMRVCWDFFHMKQTDFHKKRKIQERNSWQFHIEVNQSCENTEGQSHIKPFASSAPRVSALIQEVQKDVITFNSAIAACDEVNNSDSLVFGPIPSPP